MELFSFPAIYDTAFQFRDAQETVDFVEDCARMYTDIPIRSVVELACGTGHYTLEFARRGYDELVAFKGLNPDIGMGLSVIDIKDNEIETPDVIARRIDHAATLLGEDRIHFVHPDCGFWMLQRSVADGKIRALVEGRDRFEGRD